MLRILVSLSDVSSACSRKGASWAPLVRAQQEAVMPGNRLNHPLFYCRVWVGSHQTWALEKPVRVLTGPSIARDEEDGHVPAEGSPPLSSKPLSHLPLPSRAGWGSRQEPSWQRLPVSCSQAVNGQPSHTPLPRFTLQPVPYLAFCPLFFFLM